MILLPLCLISRPRYFISPLHPPAAPDYAPFSRAAIITLAPPPDLMPALIARYCHYAISPLLFAHAITFASRHCHFADAAF